MTNEPTGFELVVTQDEINKWIVDEKLKPVTAKRLCRVIDSVGINAFASMDKAAWNAEYRMLNPGSSIDLGKAGLKIFEKCATFIKERKFQKKLELKAQEEARAAEEAAAADAAKKVAEKEKRLNPMLTRHQMRQVADFMDMEDITEVDLRWVNDFFKMFPKEEQPKED